MENFQNFQQIRGLCKNWYSYSLKILVLYPEIYQTLFLRLLCQKQTMKKILALLKNQYRKAEPWTKLFEGRLTLTLGYILTWVSFSFALKHFPG